jgi:hypothetical protein
MAAKAGALEFVGRDGSRASARTIALGVGEQELRQVCARFFFFVVNFF